VAKILVADDNSNVQKTVALALAELGVEVVAVNNGDAAVRRLADISPDLVLADIFMPVRNGYEVCEFIKKDSRFSHVPVVLLVGAFDPLDEPEAQRVGADGILKKPFVPPDPLIAMVKTLLDRTLGDRLVAVAISKPAVSMQNKAGGGVATVEAHPTIAETPEELPEMEIPPPLDRLSFGEGEPPMAFGQLLDPPAQESEAAGPAVIEPVDDEQVLTSSRDSSLGDPIFWRTEEPAPETEEENSEVEGDISSERSSHGWNLGEDALSPRAEADLPRAIEPIVPVEPFELVRDEEEAGQTSTIVESTSLIAQDAASQASLTVDAGKPPDLAANPIEWMDSIPPAPAEKAPAEEALEEAPEWSQAASETSEKPDANETADSGFALEPVVQKSSAPVVLPAPVSASTPARPPAPPPPAPPAQPQATVAARSSDPLKTQSALKPSAQSAEDTARSIPKGDWADLTASLQPKSVEAVAEKPKPVAPPAAQAPAVPASNTQPVPVSITQPAPVPAALKPAGTEGSAKPAPTNSGALETPDPALVEAVVQRVLEKMRPQVVDIITKEFLRPVVQALVHREVLKR
jgi:CheY-like chemotaxis protein